MVFEGAQRRVRRRKGFDVETVKERPGPELRFQKHRRQPVVDLVGVGRIESLIDAEEKIENVFQPHPGGGPPEKVIMFREEAPDFPGIGFDRPPVLSGNAQFFHRDAPAVKHPEDIVIRDQEQLGRIGKGGIVRKPARIGVAVGADDGKILDLAVQPMGDLPPDRIARKESIIVHDDGPSHGILLCLS